MTPSVAAIYDLECTDCSFRTTVRGDFDDALEAVEEHRTERSAGPMDHFVNLHRRP